MKTKEYVKKYRLDVDDTFNHKEFINDLTTDFNAELKSVNVGTDYSKFKRVVDLMKQKWDNINKKTVGQLPEKLWGFFYGSVLVAKKDELFPQFAKKDKTPVAQ